MYYVTTLPRDIYTINHNYIPEKELLSERFFVTDFRVQDPTLCDELLTLNCL